MVIKITSDTIQVGNVKHKYATPLELNGIVPRRTDQAWTKTAGIEHDGSTSALIATGFAQANCSKPLTLAYVKPEEKKAEADAKAK